MKMVLKRVLGSSKFAVMSNHCSDCEVDLSEYPDIDASESYEDIPAIGNYISSAGSTFVRPKGEVMFQGAENTLDIDAQVAGEKLADLNSRGKHSNTHHTRPKLIMIKNEKEVI
jgi:hypothetical protein